MTKKNDPTFEGSHSPNEIVPLYGDTSELPLQQTIALRLAITTPFQLNEAREITRARKKVTAIIKTNDHFLNLGLPPIHDSYAFEALRMRYKL